MRVAYFVMRYPLLTETFLDREMRGLIAHGIAVEVHPLWDWGNRRRAMPGGARVVRHSFVGILASALLETCRHPDLVWRGARALARHRPGGAESWFMALWGGIFALGVARDFRSRAEHGDGVDWLHGAWATAPATAALGLSRLLDMSFSFGAQAYDLYRHGGDPLLPLKLRRARFVHTTTRTNLEHIMKRFPDRSAEILLVRRGLPELPPLREKTEFGSPEVSLLSVGRLVEKKGQVHQLAACAELQRRGIRFRLRIVGEGPERRQLEERIRALGLSASVELSGAQPECAVQRAYDAADIFLHTGIIDAAGDRDGLPNVIPEAMSRGVCVITSPGGGAAEAIAHEVTGLTADPANPVALADAIVRLLSDASLRAKLRAHAHRWVAENFLAAANTARLASAFRAQAASGR